MLHRPTYVIHVISYVLPENKGMLSNQKRHQNMTSYNNENKNGEHDNAICIQ